MTPTNRSRAFALSQAMLAACSSASSGDDDSTPMKNTTKGSGGMAAPNMSMGSPSSGSGGSQVPAMSGSSGMAAPNMSMNGSGGSHAPAASDVTHANAILRGSCATSSVRSALLPANILFVVDRTGTMACNPPPTTASDA